MNIPLFLSVFFTLTLLYALLGFFAARRVKTTTDYFLAGRNLGSITVAFTLIATQLGSGMLLGTSQQAYSYGLYGLLYTLGIIIGFIVLSCGLAGKLRDLGVETTAQLFESHFNSQTLKRIASLLSIFTLGGILIGQIVASKAVITALNIENEMIFILFWVFVILYTIIGGLEAVVITDIAQVILITVIFVGLFFYSLMQDQTIWFSWPAIVTIQQNYFSSLNLSINTIIATVLMPACYSFIEQDLAQRFFSARSQKGAIGAAFCAALFMFLFALIPIYFGMKAQLLNLPLLSGSPLIPMIQTMTNDLFLSLALCAILAASTSTADSLLCAISSNIAQDFSFKLGVVHDPIRRSKLITLFVGLTAMIGSYLVPNNIITILIASYQLSVNCLLVPSLFAYFSRTLPTQAAWGAIIAGFIAFIATPFIPGPFPTVLIPLVCSLIGYFVGWFVATLTACSQ